MSRPTFGRVDRRPAFGSPGWEPPRADESWRRPSIGTQLSADGAADLEPARPAAKPERIALWDQPADLWGGTDQ